MQWGLFVFILTLLPLLAWPRDRRFPRIKHTIQKHIEQEIRTHQLDQDKRLSNTFDLSRKFDVSMGTVSNVIAELDPSLQTYRMKALRRRKQPSRKPELKERRQAMIEQVQDEIKKHQNNEIGTTNTDDPPTLSTNPELAKKFGLTVADVYTAIGLHFDEDVRSYRRDVIQQQLVSRRNAKTSAKMSKVFAYVKAEIEQHQQGAPILLTPGDKLSRMFGLGQTLISRALEDLDDQSREYRRIMLIHKLAADEQAAIITQAKQEIRQLRLGKTVILTTSDEHGARYGVSGAAVLLLLKKGLSGPENEFLKNAIRRQHNGAWLNPVVEQNLVKRIKEEVLRHQRVGGELTSVDDLARIYNAPAPTIHDALAKGLSKAERTYWWNVSRGYPPSYVPLTAALRKKLVAYVVHEIAQHRLHEGELTSTIQLVKMFGGTPRRIEETLREALGKEDHSYRLSTLLLASGKMGPNKVEAQFMDELLQAGVDVTYTGHLRGEPVILDDGRKKIPDFRIVGTNKVIEIYGTRWHNKEFMKNRKHGRDYDWDSERMIEEYAKVGIDAKVFWTHGSLFTSQKMATVIKLVKSWLEKPPLATGHAPMPILEVQ